MAKTKDAPGSAAPGQLTSARDKATNKKSETDHELEGLMSEIESGLREDQFKKLWTRYGSAVIAFAVLLIAGVAAVQIWNQYESRQRQAVAERYTQATKDLEDAKFDEAVAGFNAVAANKFAAGYKVLARLSTAAADLGKKDEDGAVAIYTAIAADQTVDPVFRDMATILRVEHSMDNADPATLEAELAPIAGPNNHFSATALELSALLAGKQGDYARAQQFLDQIVSDPAAPSDVRDRASDLAGLFKSQMPQTQTPAAADLAKPPADVQQSPPAATSSSPPPASPPPSSPPKP